MNAQTPQRVPRAERFVLPMSILYRPAGDGRWREGRAENVSRSGVLFRGVEPVDVEMPVEILMDMPEQIAGAAAGATLCRGQIVRQEPAPRDTRTAFAAAISDWEALQLDPRRI